MKFLVIHYIMTVEKPKSYILPQKYFFFDFFSSFEFFRFDLFIASAVANLKENIFKNKMIYLYIIPIICNFVPFLAPKIRSIQYNHLIMRCLGCWL